MFTYKEVYVRESLSFFINKIWVLETNGAKDLEGNMTLVPNGCFNIAFITGQGVTAKFGKDVIALKKGIYFCGQATQSVDIVILPGAKVNMVQVFPWAISMFTEFNMKLCRNRIIPINYINKDFEREANEINHGDENQILDFLDNRFNSLLIKNEHSFLVHQSCLIIMKTMGQCSIKDLSRQLSCSSRHLQIVANQKQEKLNIRNISFQVQVSYNLTLPDKTFDVVIASNLLYIVHEPDKPMNEVKRVMKDDGIFIAPTLCAGENAGKRITAVITGALFEFMVVHKWTINEFKDMLKKNGFVESKTVIVEGRMPLAYIVLRKKSMTN